VGSGVCLLLALAAGAAAQAITTPKQHFGFNIGDDYQVATYTQLVEYWKKLDRESDRMKVFDIGKTAEGRPQVMAIITSPENFKKLDRYKEISRRLALADGLTDDSAHALAREGRAVVWIDGGLHATEVLGAHQLIETVYQLVSRSDPETLRILNDDIILAVHANPDGMELVSSWYMREPDPQKRSTSGIPRLYEKYGGHDNNRDFYMSNLPETTNMNRVLYTEWYPQIMYNHHQTGPAGTVMFAPPFRDPFNYRFDPLVPAELDLVGAAMATRFNVEGKAGVTSRKGSSYSTWFNGGLRTTVYFHNMIGLLTETIGNPTPVQIPLVLDKQLPDSNLHLPIAPQTWHFRQSIDYSVTANYAVLDIASRNRENFLFNIYQMGKNSIARGSTDSWTPYPSRIEAVKAEAQKDSPPAGSGGRGGGRGGFGAATAPAKYYEALHKPEWRDPRGYVLPADQPDFATATKFVNTLLKVGISVGRATQPFTVAGTRYPAGSYVVKCAQAFRPYVLDMFEPQDHPNDIPYPGGPPTAPYDNAGWTLAYQMGVKFDRILDGFDGPFQPVTGLQKAPPGKVGPAAPGYLLGHQMNDAFTAVNRLLAAGEDVFWIQDRTGAFYIPARTTTRPLVEKIAADLGVTFDAATARPAGDAITLRKLRIGLVDRYGGSMPSGWTRFIFEQFEFPFEVVYPQTLDAGNLNAKFDVIVFVDDTTLQNESGGRGGRGGGGFGAAIDAASIPAEYRDRLGSLTVARTLPQIRRFLENGGTVLSIGGSTSMARALGLALSDHLVERAADGSTRPLARERYFVPGSILRVAVDTANPIAHGLPADIDVMFDNSPVFDLDPSAPLHGIRPVAWFDSSTPLRSGWGWGQGYLKDGIAIAEGQIGKGRVVLFGPEIAFRAQPHGTFKLLFNGIYLGAKNASASAAATGETR
jgi:hypothetical protein